MQVTNDGATILKAIGVDNPAAKILVGKCHMDFPQLMINDHFKIIFSFHLISSSFCLCCLP